MTERDTGDIPYLVMPIDIEVLRVGHRDGNTVMLAPMYDFALLPGGHENGGERRAYITADVSKSGAPFASGTLAMPGIHLHWTLPEALRHGGEDAKPDTPGGGFPQVPNRWLVTRFLFRTGESQPAVRRWVVESDRLEPTPASKGHLPHPTVPFRAGQPGPAFRHIGRHFDAENWRETQADRFAPLTALGYGDPTFASFYPNCWTVFGFHDDLAGLPEGACRLAYHVVGWYGGTARNPLADRKWREALSRFQVLPAAACSGILCSGAVHDIEWESEERYLATPPRPLTCALGASPAEALSVLVAVAAKAPELEGGLNSLQFGLLAGANDRLDAFDTFAGLLHETGFSSRDGGSRWVIRRPEKDEIREAPPMELPLRNAVRLNRLNAWQQALDGRRAALAARRRQLFSDWYRYVLVLYESHTLDDALHGSAEGAAVLLRAEAAAILWEDARLGKSDVRISKAVAWIRRTLPKGYLIESVAGPRYWQPQDPTAMLLGDDTRPVSLSAGLPRAKDGRLECRHSGQAATKLVLPRGWKLSSIDVPGNSVLPLKAVQELPAALSRAVDALAGEAALLAPAMQRALAERVASAAPDATLPLEKIVELLSTDAAAFLDGRNPAWISYGAGAVRPHGLRRVLDNRAPWLPFLLHYELTFTPVHDERFTPDAITANFRWSESDDLYFFRKFDGTRSVGVYSGTAMLARHGAVQLANAVRGILDRYPAATGLEQLRDWVTGLPHQAQALSGFGMAMLMGRQSGQMPVADSYASPPRRADIEQVARAVGGENWLAPIPRNCFNPIRAGGLTLRKLRLVDSFGRCKDYDDPDEQQPEVLIARSLRPRSAVDDARVEMAFLPARFVQPARLQFRWLSTLSDRVETNSHPATSPVLGWVLVDNIDGGLSVFNAAGTPFGTILRTSPDKGEPALVWQSVPDGRLTGDPASALEGENGYLRKFVLGLFRGGANGFLTFQNNVRAALERIQPAGANSDDALPLLIGRPLALVRAALSLELLGGAAMDQSWLSFRKRLGGSTEGLDAGIKDIRFPVKLGGPERMNDGMVAYWNEPGGVTDFTRTFTPVPNDKKGTVLAQMDKGAVLVRADDATPTTVTMLIDPRGLVHATTGILPVKTVGVPPSHYSAALDRLGVTLRAGPVLAAVGSTLSLTVPTRVKGTWSWCTPNGARREIDDPSGAAERQELARQEILDGWLRLDDASGR